MNDANSAHDGLFATSCEPRSSPSPAMCPMLGPTSAKQPCGIWPGINRARSPQLFEVWRWIAIMPLCQRYY